MRCKISAHNARMMTRHSAFSHYVTRGNEKTVLVDSLKDDEVKREFYEMAQKCFPGDPFSSRKKPKKTKEKVSFTIRFYTS